MDQLSQTTSDQSKLSIKELLVSSWNISLKTILRFIVIGVISLLVGSGFFILAWVLGGAILGSMIGFEKIGEAVSSKDPAIWLEIVTNLKFQLTAGVIVGVYVLLAFAFQSLIAIATIMAIDTVSQPFSLSIVLQRAKKVLIPYMLLQILLGFLYVGSFFFFFLPFVLIIFFLIFANYEVVINNQSAFNALRRSVYLVTKNFGHVFIAVLIILGLQVAFQAMPGVVSQAMGNESYAGILFVFFIFYMVLSFIFSWFTTVFMMTVYKQVSGISDRESRGKVWWMWIVALLGWLIVLGIIFFSYKLAASFIEKAKQSLSSAEQVQQTEQLTYVPSSCGLEMPLPQTTDNYQGVDRKWVLDELAANPAAFYLLDEKTTPIKNTQVTFIEYRDPESGLNDDKTGYLKTFPGMEIICVDNTRALTLETFTGLLQANKNLKVEIDKQDLLQLPSGVQLQPFNILVKDKDGNELKDPGYIAVSEDSEKLIFVNLVGANNEDARADQINNETKAIFGNLRYGTTSTVIPQQKPASKPVTYTAPSNPQPTIKPGELGSQEWIDNFNKEFAETKKRTEESKAKMCAQNPDFC